MPTTRVLYRQSSVETRLSPIHLSEEDESDDENPKVVFMKKKTSGADIDKENFADELQKKLVMGSKDPGNTNKLVNELVDTNVYAKEIEKEVQMFKEDEFSEIGSIKGLFLNI